MSMDAALRTWPLCPVCEKRVDENAPEYAVLHIQGGQYHSTCVAGRCSKCGRPMRGTTAYDGACACACGGIIETALP